MWAAVAAVAAAHVYLARRRLLAYLRYFQQEGYEATRFVRWTGIRPLLDPALWLSIFSLWLVSRGPLIAALVFVTGAVSLGRLQPDPRHSGKIPLKLTWRASRVLTGAVVLSWGFWLLGVWMAPSTLRGAFLASATVFLATPLALVAANALLEPYEASVQRGYEADAVSRLQTVDPVIIGITGSYGKSSTKAMLAHILQYKDPTLAASGSINTLMGITRHIRENLVRGHRYLIVEMGAFNVGSIKRLCELTPPQAALVTAVGDMHLERFGSVEAIVRAKGELADALPPGGLLVVNADSPGALRIARQHDDKRVLLYGETSTERLDTRLENVRFARNGTTFDLRTRDRTHTCVTPLLGRPIVLNIAGAFTLAHALGVDSDLIVAAIRTLTPVPNRLEVVDDQGVTWVRDAYNSNQFGFRAALEVAAALPAARRFLVTPGVIELGPEQFTVNLALSREAAQICDSTVVVGKLNREAFIAGHRETGRDGQVVPVKGRGEAFRWLKVNVKAGDLVVLENDLPDLYEKDAGIFFGRSRRASHGRSGR
jgi:UDP-N-acetylmuramoyl-tripeptide--D-alanyl-D-alanine ligase